MPLRSFDIGEKNEDGSVKLRYSWQEEPDPGVDELGRPQVGLVYTGPIMGTVSLSDGTVYDVTNDWIQCHPTHNGAIECAIAKALMHVGRVPAGAHVCSDRCEIGWVAHEQSIAVQEEVSEPEA